MSRSITETTYFYFTVKTPMCLINELARYNKIQQQYRLTDEAGPAHKKTFKGKNYLVFFRLYSNFLHATRESNTWNLHLYG